MGCGRVMTHDFCFAREARASLATCWSSGSNQPYGHYGTILEPGLAPSAGGVACSSGGFAALLMMAHRSGLSMTISGRVVATRFRWKRTCEAGFALRSLALGLLFIPQRPAAWQ
jgi:hypothetical protein